MKSLVAAPAFAGLLLAQTTGSQQTGSQQAEQSSTATQQQTSGEGQTWTGILVSADCSSATMPRSTASAAASGNMHRDTLGTSQSDRGTTTDRAKQGQQRGPTVAPTNPGDRAADMNRDRARDVNQGTGSTDAQLERTRTMEQSRGTADRNASMDTQHGNNPSVGELSNTAGWDRACFIGKKTERFAFQTSDGRVLRISEEGNSQIKSRLQSSGRVDSSDKIFRVRVNGKIEGEQLNLTHIMM